MGKYDDIVHLKYPMPYTRKIMPAEERAAQFSPFAALSGYDEAIEETARITDQRILLSEEEMAALGDTLSYLMEHADKCRKVRITYFVPDERKAGGRYQTVEGEIKKIRPYEKNVLLSDGTEIAFGDILYMDTGL